MRESARYGVLASVRFIRREKWGEGGGRENKETRERELQAIFICECIGYITRQTGADIDRRMGERRGAEREKKGG